MSKYAKAILYVGNRGTLDVHDADGEVTFTISLSPGRYNLSDYLPVLLPDESFSFINCRIAYPNANRNQPSPAVEFKTGANPDFKPSSADGEFRKLQRLLRRTEATEKRLARREASLRKVIEEGQPALEFKRKKPEADTQTDPEQEPVPQVPVAPDLTE